MEKRISLLSLVTVLIILINSFGVMAVIGVSPAKFEIDFEPYYKNNFGFNFIFDEGADIETYVEGDLAKYVKLDTKGFKGSGGVIAELILPGKIEKPGVHRIGIGAKQIPDLVSGGVTIIGDVKGIIEVKVPYPGKYAIPYLIVENANVGDPVYMEVIVDNLGFENINVIVYIDVFNMDGELLEKVKMGSTQILTQNEEKFISYLDSSKYVAGDYKAVAVIKFGGLEESAEQIFRLGRLFVGINVKTLEFEKDKLNRFEIEAISFWNDPISNLYAEVEILDTDIKFLTPSIELGRWETKVLTGFFDTTKIENNEFQANITLYYSNKITNEIVDLSFVKEKDYKMIGIIIAVVGFILVLMITIIILFWIVEKNKKESGKKKHGKEKS